MRIISKFHDYYDSVKKYDHENDIIFIRKTEELDYSTNPAALSLIKLIKKLPTKYYYNKSEHPFKTYPFIVIICGSVHIGYRFFDFLHETSLKIYAYDIPSIEKIIKETSKEEYSEFLRKKYTYFKRKFTLSNITRSFNEIPQEIDITYHLDIKAPIFYIGINNNKTVFIKNPILKDFQFYKKIDAYSTYQQISIFVSGITSKTFPPTIELDEKTRIEKQGFNKWSFRKIGKNSKI